MAYQQILNPMPTSQTDSVATGTISATDALGGTPAGTGLLIATAPTASSFVAAAIPGGASQIDVMALGTATGSYYYEYSMDSTNGSDGTWITGLFRQSGVVNTNLNYVFTVVGVFRGACAGYKWFRIRNVGGTTPSNAITVRTSNGSGTMFLNAGLPASSNTIGAVKSAIVQQATANLTALNQALTLTMQGEAAMAVQLTGTWTATVTFEASLDNVNWTTINVQRAGDNIISQTVINSTNNDVYRIGCSGFLFVRARCSAFTSGTIVVTGATSFASATAILAAPIPAGANIIGKVGIDQTTPGTTNLVAIAANQTVNVTQINGNNSLSGNGTVGLGAQRMTIASDSTGQIAVAGRATGGATTFTLISAATTNATSLKASAGTFKQLSIGNNGAGACYVKFYNKASAPTVGTDTPVATYYVPATSGREVVFPPEGVNFATGIAYAITGVGTVADVTAVAAAQVFLNGSYA